MTTADYGSCSGSPSAVSSWPGGCLPDGVTAAVHYRAAGKPHVVRLESPGHAAIVDGLRVAWRWEPAEDGSDTWLSVANLGSVDLLLEAVDVLAIRIDEHSAGEGSNDLAELIGAPPAQWVFYQNSWMSWGPTFVRGLDDGLYVEPGTSDYRRMHQPHWDPSRRDDVSSEWVTVLKARSSGLKGQALLLGFVTTADQLSEIRLERDGDQFVAVTARCHLDGALLRPGETVCSERLWVRAGADPLVLLEGWAERTGREMEARADAIPPTGWCTWYYFYGENTAQDVLDNVAAMSEYGLPLDVIVVDDGYQTAIGDWFSLEAERFPQGMEPVARAVHRAGHRLGIWTAPFGAAADSELFLEHPDWFLRDEAGEPVVGWTHRGVDCHALDCTHPQVLSWLREVFGRMRAEWGVAFFKIDFVFAAARPGRRHDRTATRAQALRRGVEAVRAGIGQDAFLLGCGAPLGPCVGLVDGMRIGPDVDPNWHPIWRHDLSMPSAENALRSAVARAALHGRLWANDPDCVLARQRGSDMELVLNEMRTLSALVALLGGLTIDSDHLPAIRPGRLKYLRQALPPTGVSARPLDLFENEMPRLLLLRVDREWGCWWVAGLVNWNERTTETTVHLGDLGLAPSRYHVYHYWRRRYLGVTDDTVTVRRHQPHETAVLLFKPVIDRPDLLTTTFHVCQGAVEVANCQWRAAGGTLRVELRKAGRQFGRLLFAVPDEWRLVRAHVDGRRQAPVAGAAGVVSLGLTLEGRAEVEVEFERRAES